MSADAPSQTPQQGKIQIALNAGTLGAIVAAAIAAASAWPSKDVSQGQHTTQQQIGALTEQVKRVSEDLIEVKSELREVKRLQLQPRPAGAHVQTLTQ